MCLNRSSQIVQNDRFEGEKRRVAVFLTDWEERTKGTTRSTKGKKGKTTREETTTSSPGRIFMKRDERAGSLFIDPISWRSLTAEEESRSV